MKPSIRATAFCLLFAMAAGALPALAQNKVVKCGGRYQDRPCAGQEGRLVGSTRAQKAVATRHVVDPACQRRGQRAQAIIAARAEGQTEDEQLAATNSVADKRLINEVYRLPGDAAAQRSAVETQCMQDRQRVARGR